MDETLEEVKRSLEVDNEELDKQLTDFIKRISSQLCVRLGFLESVPAALNYIVVECTIKRFNRKGNEGMSSYGQEGESISYGKLLDDFEEDIFAYLKKKNGDTSPYRSVATFI